jgi:iron complex transport system substrate-binding protein
MSQKRKIVILVLLIIATAVSWTYFAVKRKQLYDSGIEIQRKVDICNKIVSLAPSTTEILFALGLGDKVIGVSEFCNWPPQAKEKQKMGGLMNPNYEAIVAAKPDLVIVFQEMLMPENKFAALGIETLAVKHDTIRDIIDSIRRIGRYCGVSDRAEEIANELRSKITAIRNKCKGQTQPRVLISVGHDISQNSDKLPEKIYIAGNDGLYSAMVTLAGGQNAYTGTVHFPAVSSESVISMNPEIIIDIVPAEKNPTDPEVITKQWKNFGQIDAVKNNRIYVFNDDFMTIPGPRIILTLEKIAHAIKPDLQPAENEQKGN